MSRRVHKICKKKFIERLIGTIAAVRAESIEAKEIGFRVSSHDSVHDNGGYIWASYRRDEVVACDLYGLYRTFR